MMRQPVENAVRMLIDLGYTDFLNGGMGAFDRLCSCIVYDLKPEFPALKNFLVIPYLSFSIQNRQYFDEVIYPEGLENYYFKSAIAVRNKFLIDNASVAVCFVHHTWGGAAQTCRLAERLGLKMIYL